MNESLLAAETSQWQQLDSTRATKSAAGLKVPSKIKTKSVGFKLAAAETILLFCLWTALNRQRSCPTMDAPSTSTRDEELHIPTRKLRGCFRGTEAFWWDNFQNKFQIFFFKPSLFQRKKKRDISRPPPKKNHEVSPPRLLSIFFSLKFPQICEIVASADIVLRQKYLFPGKLVSGEDIFDQLWSNKANGRWRPFFTFLQIILVGLIMVIPI